MARSPAPIRALIRWLTLATLAMGCGDDHAAAPLPASASGGGPTVDVVAADACATPREGCACDVEGKVVDCGVIKEKTNSYVLCQRGSRACVDGTWGSCELSGDTVTVAAPGAPDQKHPLGLGMSASCAAENVCDPFCQAVADDATGLTLNPAAGVQVTPAGLVLIQHPLPPAQACTGISLTPASPIAFTVTQFSPLSPSTLQLTAALTPTGCYPGTPPVLWAIDRFDIATINNGLLTLVSPIGGPITVTAYSGSLSATATVNVQVNVLDVSRAPAGTAGSFPLSTGTADTATILYPYANTVFPLGLLPPLLQWRYGTAGVAQAVKVSLRYPASGASFNWSEIVPENETLVLNPPTNTITLAGGPRASIPTAVWKAFEQTAKGNTGAIVLQRLTTGSVRRAEISTSLTFATNQLKGTVYYQSYGTNIVQNFSSTLSAQSIGGGIRFGAATLSIRPGDTYPSAAAGYTSASDGPGCRVCHSASASGNALVTNASGFISYLFKLGIDPASGGTAFSGTDGRYAWPALYPDGTFMFSGSGPSSNYGGTAPPGGLDGSDSGSLGNKLYSTVSGATFGALVASSGIPSTLRATLPVFSPDGTKLAFNHYGGTVSGIAGDKRSLGMMNFVNSTKTFSSFRRLVTEPSTACSAAFGSADPCTDVWPTFLPDNSGVVYEREIFNNGRVSGSNHSDFGGTRSGCDGTGVCGDNGMRGELWWVTTAATPVATRLNRANGLDAAGAVYLPTDTHTGDLDGICETGENCAEYNPAASGNDNWNCESGETCMEYAAGSGNHNYICEAGEQCAEDQSSHTAANEPVLNYEPNINPQAVGGYQWLVFTSRRRFGNVATMNPWWSDPRFKPIGGQFGATPKKIWVAAIDPNAPSGTDPSHPAFYLPGQEWLSGNSKAYWVLDACKAASATRTTANECESDLDCCGAPATSFCSLQEPIANPAKRHCIPKVSMGCIADNAATTCTSHAECCGFSTGSRCANGTCQLPASLLVYGPGTFTRDFVASCGAGKKPVWQMVQWKATVPASTSIVFTAASASTLTGLATATPVAAGQATTSSVGSAWAANPVNINTNLVAIGVGSQSYLRVVSTLQPSTDLLTTPTLSNWRVVYDCLDAE